jgi:protein-tyrosine kinase
MGRIDEALRRSNLDAARDTGAPPWAPGPSPWRFGQPGHGNSGSVTPSASELEPEAGAGPDAGPACRRSSGASVSERLVISRTAGPLLVEQFRSLAATLNQARSVRHIRSVVVASASPGDGKSLVAVNLALTLCDSYQRRVLLIDGDLRRPSLHEMFGVANGRGLSEALRTEADEKLPVLQIGEHLSLLAAGRRDSNPLGGLSSERMKRIVEEASSRFDWVILDTPPLGVRADGRVLSEVVDAAILVVRAGATQFADLEAAADTIGRERILGIVLNAVDPAVIRGQGDYHAYYGDDRAERP